MSLSLFWLYDIPTWAFCILVVSFFIAFGVAGLFCTRKLVRRLHRIDHSHNDIVGYFLNAVTVLYGITLGLVAVGTWNTFSDVQDRVDHEAQVAVAIYADIGLYPEPLRSHLYQDMRDYAHNVITVSWPLMQQGKMPTMAGEYLAKFQADLLQFQPATMAQEIMQSEIYRQFNVLVEARRARINAVNTGLSGSIWTLLIVGSLISVAVTLFFDTASFAMHFWLTTLTSGLLGLIIFLVGALDHPFRGAVSVGPDAMQAAYHSMLLTDQYHTTHPALVPTP